jgi:Plasmid pRiA4b ORF-3-like protein
MGDAGRVIIYRLKVSLRGISPMIWRRLLVPDDLTLYELHRVLQIAVGWEDYHLHAFRLHGRLYNTMMSGGRH